MVCSTGEGRVNDRGWFSEGMGRDCLGRHFLNRVQTGLAIARRVLFSSEKKCLLIHSLLDTLYYTPS